MSFNSPEFLILLKPHYNKALHYCRALCRKGDTEEAEDVFQQSLLTALENFNGLKDHGKFNFWFFKIITNTFYGAYRKRFRNRFTFTENENTIEDLRSIYPGNSGNQEIEIIYTALSKLKLKERTAILLFELGGFSIEDIRNLQSERSISAVKSRLSRAREKLKKSIPEIERDKIKSENNISGNLDEEVINILSEIKSKKGGEYGQILE
jgi:RNA polymerase sigma-70 factor, ECF subfamily